nr:hypothetical protein [uncultured Oscillibacter sp.]
MPNEPDYKSAYETMMEATARCERIIYRAQIITSVELALQRGEKLDEEIMEDYRALKALTSRT